MRFVFVLEDDPKFMREITTALLRIDPQLQVRQFTSLGAFAEWLKILLKKDGLAIASAGRTPEGFNFAPVAESSSSVLQMVVSKVEFLGARQLGLMKKTRELFIRHGVCTREDPTAFVLTAFEDPNFHVEDLRDRILSNIIIKPFDPLILEQHLTFALDGRHPATKNAVTPYKTKAIIESLKVIEMESLSNVGFITRSNRLLPKGAIGKYYARCFVTERQKSIIARLIDCRPHPLHPDEFQATLSYFGADPTQILNIRRQVLALKDQAIPSLLSARTTPARSKVTIVIIEERPEIVQSFEPTLIRKLAGARILKYSSLREFLMELDPKISDGGASEAKALAPPGVHEMEIDASGKLGNIEGVSVNFNGLALKSGLDLKSLTRESERSLWATWIAAPEGVFLSMWYYAGKSYVVKITYLADRKFNIEEGSNLDREEFSRKNSRLSQGWDFALIGPKAGGLERVELWKQMTAKGRERAPEALLKNFLISGTPHSDDEEKILAQAFDDLFFLPIDRLYLLQKMLLLAPYLKIDEDPVETLSVKHSETLKSARPIEIEEMSEAGLIMKYDRVISAGSFREFVLWQPYEVGAPEINATCNFSEETNEKEVFRLHFVFFAMKDLLLRHIRTWVLENYVRSKETS